MKVLSKKDILAAKDVRFEYIEVPEWGGTIKLYAMSLAEHLEFERIKGKDGALTGEQIVFVLSNAIRDEEGNRLFTAGEAIELLDKNTSIVSKLFMKCASLSKVSSMEEVDLEKN